MINIIVTIHRHHKPTATYYQTRTCEQTSKQLLAAKIYFPIARTIKCKKKNSIQFNNFNYDYACVNVARNLIRRPDIHTVTPYRIIKPDN